MRSWELALLLAGLKTPSIFLERELALTSPDIDPLPWRHDGLTDVPSGIYNDDVERAGFWRDAIGYRYAAIKPAGTTLAR